MADEREAAPKAGARGKWIGRVAVWVLLLGVVVLGIWFGQRQPPIWQAQLATPPTPTVAPRAASPTAVSLITPPTPAATAAPELQRPVNTGAATFTSSELVTTTMAVPVAAWRNGPAQSVALSADGRWVAFTAQSLITASLPASSSSQPQSQPESQIEVGYDDLYLYDRTAGALTQVTLTPDGAASNGWVGAPAMVPDGRYVAFYAWASNLVSGDSNAVQDLFFYDRDKATITRLSVGANGRQANDRSGDSSGESAPALSADGRFVAFHSAASNLTPGDNNGNVDVFVVDRQAANSQTSTTTLISHGPQGVAGNGDSSHPALSVDGRFVVFQSRATNLDPSGPTLQGPGPAQIYLYDSATGSSVLISRGPDGRPGDGDSSAPSISGDGRYLVYASNAGNLVAGDSNQVADIFLVDRSTGETRRVSLSSAGIQANRGSWSPLITLDGGDIVFGSDASNLISGDGNSAADLFVYNQEARHTSRVSVAVVGQWRGQEANGPSAGPAAIIPGGRLVAFVSRATNLATNLTSSGAPGVAGLYLHERVDAPTFTLSGQVSESSGLPVADVVVAAGPHRTTTDGNGNFRLSSLVGGTYTLAVAKPGYSFSPPRRTISLLNDLGAQNFEAFAGGDPDAFLDFPLPYDGSAATLMALLRDTDEGGWIDAWFDHDAPNYTKNQSMLLWDGLRRTQDLYNPSLGCYERRCYEGHDGIDFPYRDPDLSTPYIFEPILVRPAAAGVVAAVVQNCDDGDRWCNGGYGNEVILWHDNGYFTRYSHLASVSVSDGQWLTPDLTLGQMGNSGNAMGTHLHFAVHYDNGNKLWDGEKVDLAVDPFGWAGLQADPWAARGAVSRWLWRFNPSTEAILLGSEGATLRDNVGNVTVRIPAGALAGQVRVELVTGAAVAPPAASLRTLGRGFRLQVLDWLQGGNAANAAPARPVEISAGFTGAATRHLDLAKMLLYHWQTEGWSPLPTVVDQETQAVMAAGNQFGDFDLQAPLLCPADALEPDDSFDAATIATASGSTPTTASWQRLFDVAEDEDWFQVEAVAGANYQVTVEATSPGVDFSVELYDRDGLTRLANRRGPGLLTLTPVQAGNYFIRVAPEAGSALGCDAGYRLAISLPSSLPSSLPTSLPSN